MFSKTTAANKKEAKGVAPLSTSLVPFRIWGKKLEGGRQRKKNFNS